MTLATATLASDLWCCNIFYAFMSDSLELVFTSGTDTLHIAQLTANKQVAASIVLSTRVVGRLQGVQLTGQVTEVTDSKAHRDAFIKAFPYAALSLKELWSMKIETAKYTDNTLGFGTKLYYGEPDQRATK